MFTRLPHRCLSWIVSVLLTGLAMSASAQARDGGRPDAKPDDNLTRAQAVAVGPSSGPPRGNLTSFAPALRCMDTLLRNYGAKDVSVILEDIPDQTKKVSVGGKEMFVSATSQMTRASRAIRLIPYDGSRMVFKDLFKDRDEIMNKARFAVQGSISQFDDAMLRKQTDGGICLGPLCIGGAESDSFTGLSLDLSMLNIRDDLTLIPGVISKNFVLIRKRGKGFDGDLSFKKFGINYNFVLNTSDGQGQALRTLVELSAIELYGRLLKIPYWQCLGVTDDDPGVKSEVDDWWDMLQADLPSLVTYLQVQMRARGLYKGDVNGIIDDDVMRAVRVYKSTLGMADDVNLDGEFFRRYLAANHAELQPKAQERLKEVIAAEAAAAPAQPVAAAASAPAAPATAAAVPTAPGRQGLQVLALKGPKHVFRRGEPVDLEVTVANKSHLYCYLIDETRAVTQFFPNPAQLSSSVAAGAKLQFPGSFPFKLQASAKGVSETIACYASSQNLGAQAIAPNPAIKDVAALREAISQRAGQAVDVGVFDVKVQ